MIKINNLRKVYNQSSDNEFEALKNITLNINDGELVAIIGKSGAGKSTLLHIMSCIDSYEDGEYYINDILVKDLSEKEQAKIRNKEVGLVMQDFALIEDFTARDNVLLPLDFKEKKDRNRNELADKALENVSMLELKNKPVKKMSGGQKQRVAIARAIVNEPNIILADEPTGALDTKTSGEIIELFIKLNKEGRTVIIVTHDLSIANRCDRIIEIADGEI